VRVGVEVDEVLLFVDELLDFETEVEVLVDELDEVEDFDELLDRDELVPVHVPEAGLQPAPQYAEVLPQ
jgi:ribosomal protein L12E/L44/L45/RPP1/RPP2